MRPEGLPLYKKDGVEVTDEEWKALPCADTSGCTEVKACVIDEAATNAITASNAETDFRLPRC